MANAQQCWHLEISFQVLKMYAWEPFFQKEVSRLRKKEMRIIRKHSYLNALILFTFTCIPFLVGYAVWVMRQSRGRLVALIYYNIDGIILQMSFATFATYVLSSVYHTLDVRKAFVTISFFNALRNPLQALPDAISNLTQVRTCMICSFEKKSRCWHHNTGEWRLIGDKIFHRLWYQ